MMLPSTRPDAILFDLDGTLVDSFQWLLNIHNNVRIRMGYAAWDARTFESHMHASSRVLYPQIFADRAPQAFDILNEELARHDYNGMAVAPGATDLLQALHTFGMPMALVSNKTHAGLINDVAHYGWGEYFQSVVGAGRAARDKPSPDPAYLALMEMGQGTENTGNIWYVGDTGTDVAMAQNAGFFMIVIGHRVQPPANGVQYQGLIDLADDLARQDWFKT